MNVSELMQILSHCQDPENTDVEAVREYENPFNESLSISNVSIYIETNNEANKSTEKKLYLLFD